MVSLTTTGRIGTLYPSGSAVFHSSETGWRGPLIVGSKLRCSGLRCHDSHSRSLTVRSTVTVSFPSKSGNDTALSPLRYSLTSTDTRFVSPLARVTDSEFSRCPSAITVAFFATVSLVGFVKLALTVTISPALTLVGATSRSSATSRASVTSIVTVAVSVSTPSLAA